MPDHRTSARIIGALFLGALIANLIGSELLDAIVIAPDYLTQTYARKSSVILGMLFEITSAACVIGIAVYLYPILKPLNRNIALGYLGLRLVEPAITIIIVLASLSILTLSQQFLVATSPDSASFQLLGTLIQGVRDWALMIYILIFSLGAALFYGLLYRSRLVPRLLSIWGLAGATILLTGALVDMFGYDIDVELYGAVMGLNEVVFPLWLIFKGFNAAPIARLDQSVAS
jgi:Domain of unknown function (DUF4386)